ncbi:hypothetical protein [Janthinobacterium sp. CG3]|uniref:hypothetical protein n=1 Tax=Janthinobacterium sp. CG3 TaxID=1075768 RepID=UPI0003467D60|nr:hypothetical protein [Janthinobacterium sp. CG3]
MATTDEDQKKASEDFAAGYDEDQPVKKTIGDDEAFGLMPDEAPGANTPAGSAPTVTIAPDADAAGADNAAAAAPAGDAAAPALDVEKETQRLKSWEGRLKVQAAELAAKANTAAALDETSVALAGGTEEGDDDADEKALTEDFGPEFVALITAIVKKICKRTAEEHTAPYRKDIDDVIAELNNEKQRAHYEKIVDAYPDFMDIANSDEFKAWIEGLEPENKADVERVVNEGNAKEIIAMLKEYKASLAAPAPEASGGDDMTAALDAAEGVRSGGLKLPAAPVGKDDYASAWNEN